MIALENEDQSIQSKIKRSGLGLDFTKTWCTRGTAVPAGLCNPCSGSLTFSRVPTLMDVRNELCLVVKEHQVLCKTPCGVSGPHSDCEVKPIRRLHFTSTLSLSLCSLSLPGVHDHRGSDRPLLFLCNLYHRHQRLRPPARLPFRLSIKEMTQTSPWRGERSQ